MTEKEIALILALKKFNVRRNLIVPNVSWGLDFRYEIDLLVVTPALYATEVEIKTSFSDLKKDFDKKHFHDDERIKNLWFAIPKDIYKKSAELIPDEAGIIVIRKNKDYSEWDDKNIWNKYYIKTMRAPKQRKAKKLTEKEHKNLQRLMAMRYWSFLEKDFNKRMKGE